MLTELTCRNAKPTVLTKDRYTDGKNGPKLAPAGSLVDNRLFDTGGLLLLVRPTDKPEGVKLWRYRYSFAGKRRMLALGAYPTIKLAEARTLRDEAKRLLASGVDPAAKRRDDKLAAKLAIASSFEDVAREWLKANRKRWSEGNDKAKRRLERAVFPLLGRTPVAEVTAPQLLAVLRKIETTHEMAARTLGYCRSVLAYAVATGRAQVNVAESLRGTLEAAPPVKHRAALKASQLPDFFAKLDAYQGFPQTALAMRLLMLTAVRPGELRGATWGEFDTKAAVWRIPATRMKMRQPHVVPLCAQALAILELQQRLVDVGDDKLVFVTFDGRSRVSENYFTQALAALGYKGAATGHGMRSLFSTVANEHGWPADAIERQLAHVPKDRVRSAYNAAEWLAERRKLMAWWGDYLDAAADGRETPAPTSREVLPSASSTTVAIGIA